MRSLIILLFCGTLLGGEWWGEWDRSTNAVNGYVVRYGPSSGNKFATRFVGDTNKVALIDIPDGVVIFIEVFAIGTNGVLSLPSNEYVVRTNRVDPPTNLRSITNVTKWEVVMTNIWSWRAINNQL